MTFRCVMGAYDPETRRFWAYQASTVPNAMYVDKCHRESMIFALYAQALGREHVLENEPRYRVACRPD